MCAFTYMRTYAQALQTYVIIPKCPLAYIYLHISRHTCIDFHHYWPQIQWWAAKNKKKKKKIHMEHAQSGVCFVDSSPQTVTAAQIHRQRVKK